MLHELPEFELHEPTTLGEAVEALRGHGGKAKVLAGGTDLLGLMKDKIGGLAMPIPEALVDVKKVPELRSIVHTETESVIGAASTLSQVSADAALRGRFPALVQGADSVGTFQIRNMGTLGGNLCQRPWCWYFRHPAYDCFKKGGRQCYAITGNNSTYFAVFGLGVCVMAHPSDTAPPLIALDASAEIAGPVGVRTVPMRSFFLGPREMRDHVVGDDEILSFVRVPVTKKRSVYLKQRVRNNWDFALTSCAAAARAEDGLLSSVTVVLGGVAPMPWTVEGLEELMNDGLTEAAKSGIRAHLSEDARPLRLNRYKVRMVNALVIRALDSLSRGK